MNGHKNALEAPHRLRRAIAPMGGIPLVPGCLEVRMVGDIDHILTPDFNPVTSETLFGWSSIREVLESLPGYQETWADYEPAASPRNHAILLKEGVLIHSASRPNSGSACFFHPTGTIAPRSSWNSAVVRNVKEALDIDESFEEAPDCIPIILLDREIQRSRKGVILPFGNRQIESIAHFCDVVVPLVGA